MKPILVKIYDDEKNYYWVDTVCGARDVLAVLVTEDGTVTLSPTENIKVQTNLFETK